MPSPRRLVLTLALAAPTASTAAQDPAAAQAPAAAQEPYVPKIAPASDEAAQAKARFAPAPGFHVELFAAEPLLANPVAFAIDPSGAVYVAETFRHHQGVTDIRDHMDWLDEDLASRTVEDRRAMIRRHEGENYDAGYGHAFDQVRRLFDEEHDGLAERSTVFATGFADHAAGIGAGVLSYKGSVYYTCIPDLWLLRDPDGNGEAELRQPLSSGYGVHVALLGHDLHGLAIGPDRRLYFSCGDRGFHVETPAGTIAHPQCGAVLRCELDGSHLEVWHTGLRNPQELAFDDQGNLWTGDNNSDGGDRARWVNVVEGGDSGWRYAYQWITEPELRGPWNDEKLWHPHFDGQAAYLVPPVANLADGPSGLAYYPGTGLTSEYAGHFFLCDFRGDAAQSGIHSFTVEPRGASWALGPVAPFLWGALVTDCDFGFDGALWFSDWVYGWEQTGKGRIYRVAADAGASPGDGAPAASEVRTLLDGGLSALGNERLVELLAHADRRVRQEAHFELALRGGLDELTRVAQGATRVARLHALWALGILARKDARAFEPLLAATEDGDAEVRAQAIRVLGDERHAPAAARALALLSDGEPRVRFFAALAAGRLGTRDAVPALSRVLADAGQGDTNLRHAAVMGLVGAAAAEDLERLSADASADVRMGALLALRRRGDATVARFLLDPEPRLVLEAARAIYDVPIPGALESLARADAKRAPQGGERALLRRVLAANERLGRAETLASYAEREELALEFRIEALAMLADWGAPPARDRLTNEWRPLAARAPVDLPALAGRLARGPVLRGPDALVEGFVRFVGSAGAKGLATVLAGLVSDAKRGSAVKTAALEVLESLAAENLVPTVRVALGDRDGRVRASALERLERIAPAEVLDALPEIVAQGEVAERRTGYRLLARHAEPECVALLAAELDRLAAGLVPAELALDLLTAAEARPEPGIRERLTRHAAARAAEPALAPWLDGLFGGDARAGERVFQRVDLSCTRCHAWWPDAAERVGPNLSGVGARLTQLQLLESIVTPNRRTTPGFGGQAFFLTDGRVVAGRVVEETDTLVRLFNANNDPVALDRALIAERRADLSAMPEDLVKTVSRAEMRDLLAYLAGL